MAQVFKWVLLGAFRQWILCSLCPTAIADIAWHRVEKNGNYQKKNTHKNRKKKTSTKLADIKI